MLYSLSSVFSVGSGVRQDVVLSPFLFNLYIDKLICALKLSDLGCHVGGAHIGCIVYADDILLLSACVVNLQNTI